MMVYFLGVIVSALVQWLKSVMKTSGYMTMLLLAVVALVASAGYTLLVHVGLWETVATVLLTAGSFYAFIIKTYEDSTTPAVSLQG